MSIDIAILDFGSGRITVQIGRRGAAGTLVLSASSHVKYEGFKDGEWLKPQTLTKEVSAAIAAAEKQANIKLHDIYIGVPAEFSACSVKELSLSLGKRRKVTDADLDTLAKMGEDFSTEAPAYTVINCQPISYTLDDERHTTDSVVGTLSSTISGQLSYILAENKFISVIQSIMDELDIEITDYVSAPLAEAMFLLDGPRRDLGAVLIDIGYITTSVAVVKGDGLLSLSSFSLGGGHVTADLLHLGAPFNEAENLKRSANITVRYAEEDCYKLGENEYEARLVNNLIMSRIEVFAKNISKCLSRCKYKIPAEATYYLTGGGLGYMHGAAQLLGNMLGNDVELITPPIAQMSKPDLSSSLGLLDMLVATEGEPAVIAAPAPKKKGFFAKLFGG